MRFESHTGMRQARQDWVYASILKINNSLLFPSESLRVICKHLQAGFHGAELQAKLSVTSVELPRETQQGEALVLGN